MKIPVNTCQRSRRYSESTRASGSGAAGAAGLRIESTTVNRASELQLLTQPAGTVRRDRVDSEVNPALRDLRQVHRPHVKHEFGRVDLFRTVDLKRVVLIETEPVETRGTTLGDEFVERW